MPRYYFNVIDRSGCSREDEGTELQDLNAARREAVASARDLIIDRMKSSQPVEGQSIEIVDCHRTTIETMRVDDLLNVHASLREKYREIEFSISNNNDGTWAWKVEPPMNAKRPLESAGRATGGQNEAILSARKAIGRHLA
jgi:hypothetical protein